MDSEGIQLEGANEWEMHMRGHDGRPYFYNWRTRESTWKPPPAMMTNTMAVMMKGSMMGDSQGAATGSSVPLDRHGFLFVLRLVFRRVRASVCSSQHSSVCTASNCTGLSPSHRSSLTRQHSSSPPAPNDKVKLGWEEQCRLWEEQCRLYPNYTPYPNYTYPVGHPSLADCQTELEKSHPAGVFIPPHCRDASFNPKILEYERLLASLPAVGSARSNIGALLIATPEPLDRHGFLFVLRLFLRRVRASVCSSQHRSVGTASTQAGSFAGRCRAAAAS